MKKLFVLLAFSSLFGNVYAKNSADIFSGSTSSLFLFSQSASQSYRTSFWAATAYDHAFSSGLQIGMTATASMQSESNIFSLTAGPAYNFNADDLENSFFVGIQGGGVSTNYTSYHSFDSIVAAEIGKRFKLAEGICYSPGFSASKALGPNSNDPTYSINIFKFSVLF